MFDSFAARLRRRSLIALLAVGLVACGFRLAGDAVLPEQLSSLRLVTRDFNASQNQALQQRLRRAGVTLADADASTVPQLTVKLVVIPDRELITSASSGRTIRQIARGLEYSLAGADGEILSRKTLRQQRDYTRDDDNLLASNRELERAVVDLELALFNLMIQQLKRI